MYLKLSICAYRYIHNLFIHFHGIHATKIGSNHPGTSIFRKAPKKGMALLSRGVTLEVNNCFNPLYMCVYVCVLITILFVYLSVWVWGDIPYTHGWQPDEFDAEPREGLYQHIVHEEAAHLRQRAAKQAEGGRRVRVDVLVCIYVCIL